MKRILMCVLCVLLLGGCGQKVVEPAEPSGTEPPVQLPAVEVISGSYLLAVQQEVYGPQTDRLYFYLENQSDREIMTGVDHGLQVMEGGNWMDVPFREGYAWTAEGLLVPPGETIALTCNLEMFDYDFSAGGTFRIVKTVEGTLCAAEFRIDPKLSEDTVIPLEELPLDYSSVSAEETAVVFTADGVENGNVVLEFLEQYALEVSGRLRTVQDYGEGAVMVIDVVYENDHFLWRMWDGGIVTEKRYSYLVTDGVDVYLSNGNDWESTQRYDSEKTLLIPVRDAAASALVKEVSQNRIAGNVTRYQIWSTQEGPYLWNAGLSGESDEFFVERRGSGVQGRRYTLEELKKPGLRIKGIAWQEDGCLLLTCKTEEEGTEFIVFDPKTDNIC